jgi:hypothetical protein
MSRNGTIYLNSRGDKWIILEDGKKPKVTIEPDMYNKLPEKIVRTAIRFESFGNYASVVFKYKGKLHSSLNFKLVKPVD